MTAFAEAEIVPDFKEGVVTIAQAYGMGGLAANTILMGWSRNPAGRVMALDMMRDLVALEKSVLFLRYDLERGFGQRKIINVLY